MLSFVKYDPKTTSFSLACIFNTSEASADPLLLKMSFFESMYKHTVCCKSILSDNLSFATDIKMMWFDHTLLKCRNEVFQIVLLQVGIIKEDIFLFINHV